MKPANILIFDDEFIENRNIRISDFGSAKILKESNLSEKKQGNFDRNNNSKNFLNTDGFTCAQQITLIYSPPEMIISNEKDESIPNSLLMKHDIFSLGIIANEILGNGRNPFEYGDGIVENIKNIKKYYKLDYQIIEKNSPIDDIITGLSFCYFCYEFD